MKEETITKEYLRSLIRLSEGDWDMLVWLIDQYFGKEVK